MISKINKIQNFAIFNNFRWDSSTPSFKRYNLIYGWNYSGKTTLSRVFRCFQLGQLHNDYQSATFEVELKDGNKYNQSQLIQLLAVRVFNSDFIKENLKWEAGEEGIEPVLLLGEENIKLEQQLKVHRAELEDKKKKIDKLQRDNSAKKDEIEKELTDTARVVRTTLSLVNFEKPQFRPIVEQIAETPEKNKLSDPEFQNYLKTYQSTEKRQPISEITLSIPNIQNLCSQTQLLLKKTATANIIKRLKENSALEEWVKQGVGFHKGKSVCEFCGGQLLDDRLDELNAHFSKEYNLLMTEIDQLANNLENKKIHFELPDDARFYPELQNKYKQSSEELKSAIGALNETIAQLLRILETKKTKPFEAIEINLTPDNMCLPRIGTEINNINLIIQKHNEQTKNFEAAKNMAKDKLIKHWASEFASKIKYNETLKEIEEKETEIKRHKEEQEIIQGQIQSIEQKLSDAVKGAEKINEYLHSYFGTDEIKMTVAEDGKNFKLYRSGHPANNLSEGEKTAIAFSHFMTTLADKNTTLADTIVFIDDPVSSLDSNHLFHTYSFIKSQLAHCKQLFISTHNFELFNLTKDWFNEIEQIRDYLKRRQNKQETKWSCYLIAKTKNPNDYEASFTEIPDLLIKFKSEYVYLFSLLHKFNKCPKPDYDYLYILPNLVRRYLEAYVGFRTLGGLSSNLSILIEDEMKREKVFKLINAYSHNSSNPRLLYFPDFSECESVVDIVLNAVQDKDENHYDALVKICGNEN